MPPKVKITQSDIIKASIDILRAHGSDALNARNIASALNCSTQPIFSNFTTMEALQEAVALAAYERYLSFLQEGAESNQYPTYKAFGMAYIRFAKEERELFKLLFMADKGAEKMPSSVDWETSIEMIMNANNISRKKAELMHLEMWVSVHGIATMLATSYLSLDWALISNMLTDIYQGIRTNHLGEEEEE